MDPEARRWMWISVTGAAMSPAIIAGVTQAGLFGANPGTYFALGMLATGALVGGAYAGRDAWRIARRRGLSRPA